MISWIAVSIFTVGFALGVMYGWFAREARAIRSNDCFHPKHRRDQ